MDAVALLTRDEKVVAVRVREVDGMLVELDGRELDLVDVVAVFGLPELDEEPRPMICTR